MLSFFAVIKNYSNICKLNFIYYYFDNYGRNNSVKHYKTHKYIHSHSIILNL